ncbi:adenylate/guanylate cyclase domain-containing protein [Ruegeria marina]|uniref:Adenylate cyclase, class 3 n=1 Tax=Ruegeria marina TaxID=639004 RepID=A0A1G6QGW5_9RHOB|nr:adenylate/guanylate cyclase domain-containing protein [Ruegeria marina]SDC91563.1 Adenylate cyclase, class 3 [Ruegeria marina]
MNSDTDPQVDLPTFRAMREREAASRDILRVITSSREDSLPVFDVILAHARRLCDSLHAGLFLVSEDGKELQLAAYQGEDEWLVALHFQNPPRLEDTDNPLVRSAVTRTVILISDTETENPDPNTGGARSLLHVPLLARGRCHGVLSLAGRVPEAFPGADIELIQLFADHAMIAVENVRQFCALRDKTEEVHRLNQSLQERVEEQVGELERMGRLKRFLPPAVADTIVSLGADRMLSSHRALLGVLFCDIRGFTAFCETAEPEETIEVLQTYHEEMGKLINAHGAGVDHRMGDGIMVLFNDPIPCENPAGEAVRLAVAMRARMAELGRQWKRLGYRLGFGVGVSLGYATVGMVGSEGRFDYTASGTAINLGSRLCDEAEDGEILLSPRAAIAVEDEFRVVSRGTLHLKGIREPIEVFKLEAETGQASLA